MQVIIWGTYGTESGQLRSVIGDLRLRSIHLEHPHETQPPPAVFPRLPEHVLLAKTYLCSSVSRHFQECPDPERTPLGALWVRAPSGAYTSAGASLSKLGVRKDPDSLVLRYNRSNCVPKTAPTSCETAKLLTRTKKNK
ncbi:Piso0_003929 [Millerozyma farinosa CBS 7064]|uniref:Piso0_003929 protein n=1 Tax=Pichia sorbitophila (strain ATCC MYA-4447 / BCRC 22081 / CBS 7064 / NBRC 10061 / NRRL Y-12695) TaxID=559304 RepID=G8Y9X1_PICSO|nr:Piso0_003929 [Millerozyma farinosa CBS 7064]CCE84385.1 Piso0_003929 [Millerozyma farinosa CBS 7064]